MPAALLSVGPGKIKKTDSLTQPMQYLLKDLCWVSVSTQISATAGSIDPKCGSGGTSLGVLWLRICHPEDAGLIPGWGTKTHMLQSVVWQKKKIHGDFELGLDT